MTIGVLTGYWSTNIGNSFFQLGAAHVLQKLFPEATVFPIGDQPGYVFPKKGTPKNAFDLTATLKMDYLVILGPFIRPEFEQVLLPTLQACARRGTKFIMLGIGMMKYDQGTIQGVKSLIRDLPISAFVSRDRQTYEAFQDVCPNTFDGIDIAFFISDVWRHGPVPDLPPYIALNFDQIPEPEFARTNGALADGKVIELGSSRFELKFQELRRKVSEKHTLGNILERMVFPQTKADKVGEFGVIRTDHRYNPFVLKKVYNAPNTYSGDVPYSYLSIYKGAYATLSNRVHACVATLAFGNRAMLVSKTPRAYLLDRAGAGDLKKRPVQLDPEMLRIEKQNYVDFLRRALQAKPAAAKQ